MMIIGIELGLSKFIFVSVFYDFIDWLIKRGMCGVLIYLVL